MPPRHPSFITNRPTPPDHLILALYGILQPCLELDTNISLDCFRRYLAHASLPHVLRRLRKADLDGMAEHLDDTAAYRGAEPPLDAVQVIESLCDTSTEEPASNWTTRLHLLVVSPHDQTCVISTEHTEKPRTHDVAHWCQVIAQHLVDGPLRYLNVLPEKPREIYLTLADRKDLYRNGNMNGYYSHEPIRNQQGDTIGSGYIGISDAVINPFELIGIIAHEPLHAALEPGTEHGPAFASAAQRLGFQMPRGNVPAAGLYSQQPPPWALDAHNAAGTLPQHQRNPDAARRRGCRRQIRLSGTAYSIDLVQRPFPLRAYNASGQD